MTTNRLDRPRHRRDSRRASRALVLAAVVLGLMTAGGIAFAYWTTPGSGTGSALTGTLNAPTGVTASATPGSSTVSVSWTPSAGTPAPTGYRVVRTTTSTSVAVDACGTTSSLVTGSTCNDTSVPDGTYTYMVTAVYRTWTATSGASNSVTVVGDNTPPALQSINRAAGAANPTKAATLTWTVTFSEPVSGVTSSNFTTVKGTGITGTLGAPLVTGSGATYTVAVSTTGVTGANASNAIGLNLANGTGVHDAAGNATTSSAFTGQTYDFDTTAPTVAAVSSTLADGSYKAGQVVPVTVSFSEPVTVTGTPQLLLSTGTPATTAVSYSSGSGTSDLTFSYTVAAGNTSSHLDYAATTSLALNGGTIRDAVTNSATLTLAAPGTAGSLGANKNLVVDTTAPAVTVTAPANGSLTNSGTPTLSGAAGNATGDSATVTVRVYNGPGTGGTLLQTLAPTRTAATWSATAAMLAQGTYTVQATQTDSAGNTGSSTANTFTVDTTAPAVTVTAPANGSLTNSGTPTLSGAAGNATGDSATVTVRVYNGSGTGGTLLQTLAPTRTAATWSATAAMLAQGTYTVQATQTDSAGNTGSSTANTFTVDTTAPAVTVTAPANGSFTNSGTPTLSGAAGNATGDSATVTVRVYNGSGTGGTLLQTLAPTRTAATWSATAAMLAQGTYTVQATQTDSAGNTGSSTANTFTVDTASPSVTIGSITQSGNSGSGNIPVTANESGTVEYVICPGTVTTACGSMTSVSVSAGIAQQVAYSGLRNSTQTVFVKAVDQAGNQSSLVYKSWTT